MPVRYSVIITMINVLKEKEVYEPKEVADPGKGKKIPNNISCFMVLSENGIEVIAKL